MFPKVSEDDVLLNVRGEEERQVELWGVQDHPDGTDAVKYGSACEMAREACEAEFDAGNGSWLAILIEEAFEAASEEDEDALIVELTQVAAVATNWIRSIKRRQDARIQGVSDRKEIAA